MFSTHSAQRTNDKHELSYTWISDSGHAWLEVSIDEINALNIGHRISDYSYINGETVYLEEDCDAPIFIEALKEKLPPTEYVTFKGRYINGDAPCRQFKRFGQ
jgi:hypothetical protein